ncbi:Cullin family profile domain-containing protein [[Candida] zeylanoides]
MSVLELGATVPEKRKSSHLRARPVAAVRAPRPPPWVAERAAACRAEVMDAVREVLCGAALPHSYEWYHRATEKLCRHRPSEQSAVADGVFGQLQQHFEAAVWPQARQALATSDELECARQYLAVFEAWRQRLVTLGSLLLYLDRSYLKQHPTRHMIGAWGLQTWVAALAHEGAAALMRVAEVLLHRTRRRRFADSAGASALLAHLVHLNAAGGGPELSLQRLWIDRALADHTLMSKHSLSTPQTYLADFRSLLVTELKFMRQCGESRRTQETLKARVKWVWLFKSWNAVLQAVLPHVAADAAALGELHQLCLEAKESSLDALNAMYYEWGQFVHRQVMHELVASDVTTILALYRRLQPPSLPQLQERLEYESRTAFAGALNDPKFNSQVISSLTQYCHAYLKRPAGPPDEFVANVLTIFKLITNKATFLTAYKRDLCRRMLLGKSQSLDVERSVIDHICSVVGHNEQDNLQLRAVFDDLQVAAQPYRTAIDNPPNFSPIVLNKQHWPSFAGNPHCEMALPASLQSLVDDFAASYHQLDKRNANKVLDWGYFMYHQLTIAVEFERGTKDLVLNLLQAAVLLLFEGSAQWTAAQVATRLNVTLPLASAALASLKSVLISASGVYAFNAAFWDPHRRVKVAFAAPRSDDAATAVGDVSPRDRTTEVRALVVRTMKSVREISYTSLLGTLAAKLTKSGPISTAELKRNIEYAIDAGFLERMGDKVCYIP